ncbi:MAG: cyclomaltodextrinase C-terminal domain-containing protein, partial [Bacteroidota bacterium]
IRNDFPGGWPGDETNAFVPEGRTSKQNEMVNYLTKLLNFRKDSEAIQNGKTLHFVPEDHVYVYFRHLKDEAVMVMLNNAEEESRTIGADRYREILSRYNTGKDVISDKTLTSLDEFEIPAKSAKIIELKK